MLTSNENNGTHEPTDVRRRNLREDQVPRDNGTSADQINSERFPLNSARAAQPSNDQVPVYVADRQPKSPSPKSVSGLRPRRPVDDAAAPSFHNDEKGRPLSTTGPLAPRVFTSMPPIGESFINTLLQLFVFAAAIAFGVFAIKSVNLAHEANRLAALAVREAQVANQLAMLAACSQADEQNTPGFCGRVLGNEAPVLTSAASALFTGTMLSTLFPGGINGPLITSSISGPAPSDEPAPSIPAATFTSLASSTSFKSTTSTSRVKTPTPVGAAPPSSSSGGVSGDHLLAIIIPIVIIVFLTIFFSWLFYYMRKRHRAGAPGRFNGVDEDKADARQAKESWTQSWWRTYRAWFLESTVTARDG